MLDALGLWLEARFGLAHWVFGLLILPLVAALALYVGRRMLLANVYREPDRARHRRSLSIVSLYGAILAGLGITGLIWNAHTDDLARLFATAGRPLDQLERELGGLLYAVLATSTLALMLFGVHRGFHGMRRRIVVWSRNAKEIRLQKVLLLTPERIRQVAVLTLRAARLVIVVALFNVYVPLVLSFFPLTAPVANEVMPIVMRPMMMIAGSVLGYIPRLVTLIVIVIAVRYLLRLIRFIMTAVEKEEITVPGFDPEWSEQTYLLTRVVVVLATVMIAYPFLPGAGSEIFRGFSVFVGALFTLGASGAVGNLISGIILTYARSFRIGDRVQIGKTVGDVVERRLFVTRLRTLANEIVTIPNGVALGGRVINFSAGIENGLPGLGLRVEVGIGYEVDWRKVHELLLAAAAETPGLIPEPRAFVLQSELDDHAVAYTLVAFTDAPNRSWVLTSELRRSVLDRFNEAGVEIMTPAVSQIRNAPDQALPEDYATHPVVSALRLHTHDTPEPVPVVSGHAGARD